MWITLTRFWVAANCVDAMDLRLLIVPKGDQLIVCLTVPDAFVAEVMSQPVVLLGSYALKETIYGDDLCNESLIQS